MWVSSGWRGDIKSGKTKRRRRRGERSLHSWHDAETEKERVTKGDSKREPDLRMTWPRPSQSTQPRQWLIHDKTDRRKHTYTERMHTQSWRGAGQKPPHSKQSGSVCSWIWLCQHWSSSYSTLRRSDPRGQTQSGQLRKHKRSASAHLLGR